MPRYRHRFGMFAISRNTIRGRADARAGQYVPANNDRGYGPSGCDCVLDRRRLDALAHAETSLERP